MKTIFLLAVIGVAVASPGYQFKNLYKPVANPQKGLRPRIIGGSEAAPHSRPFQAFLEVHDSTGGGWYCGGEVVSNNYILTAGHCGDGGQEAIITLGAHEIDNSNEPTQVRVNSNDITVNPQYDANNILNDIAAFRFASSVTFNDNIQPVALPSRADAGNTFVGETSTVSGWGLTTSGGDGNLSPVLKVLNSAVVANSQCERDTNWDIPTSQICISGSNGTGSCSGDSGGPMTVSINGVPTLVGIVSYGVVDCLPGYPSVFTRVTSYLDWIASATDATVN